MTVINVQMIFTVKSWIKAIAIFLVGLAFSLAIHLPGSSQLNSQHLIKQAQSAYVQELYQESLALLKTAESNFLKNNQTLQQAQIQSLISLNHQQLGNWNEAQQAIDYGLALIATNTNNVSKQQILAQIWNAQGQLYLSSNKAKQALSAWEKSRGFYQSSGDLLGEKGASINIAQALENLGLLRRACKISLQNLDFSFSNCEDLLLADITSLLAEMPPPSASWQIQGLRTIGNTLFLMGKLSSAQTILEHTLTSTEQSSILKSKILLSLARVYQAKAIQAKEQQELDIFKTEFQKALNLYQEISQTYPNNSKLSSIKLEAKLNQLALLIVTKKLGLAKELVSEIKPSLDNFPITQRSISAKLNFARSLKALKKADITVNFSWLDIAQIYTQVIEAAEKIDAQKIVASGYGYLGQLAFEQNLQLKVTPQQMLTQAIKMAQTNNSPEIAYRWQWQLGRIYRAKGEQEQAIISYQAAFTNLQDLRSDLISLNQDIQFSFREQVEPVYREFADLLVQKVAISNKPEIQKNLALARNVIEALQLAELDNYFKDACLVFEKKDIGEIDSNAATIYTIALPESLEVILNLPNGKLYHHSQSLKPNQLAETIKQLRINLLDPSELLATQSLSREVYGWLIEPFESQLSAEDKPIKTLVFVLDGVLQNIPMSVLYDGEQYLLEKFAIAITPGLQLLNLQQSTDKFLALAGGVSKQLKISNKSFTALSTVPQELETINSNINSETLIDEQFNTINLNQKLNTEPFSIVHLATHGQFSSNPAQTFIVIWDRLLTLDDLSTLLRKRNTSTLIDLLVLSACETAIGDDRAALGLAGMAVRTGASTTLATLWQVDDDSTSNLMANFYQQFKEDPLISKSEALRRAQIKLWKDRDKDWEVPTFWASYILVGNWQ